MERTECPYCGKRIMLSYGQLRALLCETTGESFYAYQCPSCLAAVVRPSLRPIIDRLQSFGSELTVWHLPAELDESHDGPPISHDDLLEFHFALAGSDQLTVEGAEIPTRRDRRNPEWP